VADILARYYRQQGREVFFLTGTDEHGAKNAQSAEEQGKKPQEFVDEMATKYKDHWQQLNIAYDDFIRTTETRHKKVVQKIFADLKNAKTSKGNDAIFEGEYSGLYCVGCEAYKKEEDLVDGKCPDHDKAPEFLKEKNWYFRLSDYADWLSEKIQSDQIKILPEGRKKEVLSFIKNGLDDVPISRQQVKWGIPVPFDQEQAIYVWVDALINYISALGYPDDKKFKKFWPAEVQLLAKDILKFHCIIWPAMLKALEIEQPKTLFVHGFFTVNGQKMGKTLGNVIDPAELVAKYGADAARYLIVSQFPFGNDGDIKEDEFVTKYNADLANGLGNLVSRVLGMTEKYFDGVIPSEVKGPKMSSRAATDPELCEGKRAVKGSKIVDFKKIHTEFDQNFTDFKILENVKLILHVIKQADLHISETKPWEITDNQQLANIIYNLLETIRELGNLIIPFLPKTSEKIFAKLNIEEGKVTKGDPLFERK